MAKFLLFIALGFIAMSVVRVLLKKRGNSHAENRNENHTDSQAEPKKNDLPRSATKAHHHSATDDIAVKLLPCKHCGLHLPEAELSHHVATHTTDKH